MDAYLYQGALLCEHCGEDTRRKLERAGKAPEDADDEESYDSDDYPKGPYADGGGEADTPQHCDQCGMFLENALTTDGLEYVEEAIEQYKDTGRGNLKVLKEWAEYYDIPFDKEEIGRSRRNPSQQTGWRSYGPGKFQSVVDSHVYAISGDGGADDEASFGDGGGWAGVMRFKPGELVDLVSDEAQERGDSLTAEEREELRDVIGVIMTESSTGLVYIDYYDAGDERKLETDWEETAAEYEIEEAEGE